MSEPDKQQVVEELKVTHEHVFDPETAPKVLHNWVKRGIKMSCENAGHAHHEVWLRTKPMQQ